MTTESDTVFIRELIKQYAQMHGISKREAITRLIKKLKKV